jgi:glycosyltransferase involved in cell wall biosynthesis
VIPNGVDWPSRLPDKDWSHPGRKIIYAGSLFPWKGAADLVMAASHLQDCQIDMIGGDPQSVRSLQELAPPAGAALVFSGQLPHEQVLDRLSAACIAVLPNRADPQSAFTSPIKLFEYMAAGCALVATDVPAVREIIGTQAVAWCRPGDPQDLARAIAMLAGDAERCRSLGASLRNEARAFTWAGRADKLEHVFADVSRGSV